jgi:hypothetical protein
MARLTWAQVCARRLDRQSLARPARDAAPADIVASLGAVHAQVMPAAELSIALRLSATKNIAVREALWTERTLVKTRGPRGTVHVLATHDLPMWTGALLALPEARGKPPDDVRMTSDQTDRVVAAIADALADAELTVDGLTDAIAERAGPWAADKVLDAFQDRWPRWRQAEYTAVVQGAMCFGPNRGRQVTYTSPSRWLPDFQPDEARLALRKVVKRYLYAYGPATPDQFAQWLGTPRPWATELFATMGDELERVDVEGTTAFAASGDTAAPSERPRGVRLLPYFDAYPVGCHPRQRVFPGRAADRALNRGQAGGFPVLLVNGIVAGVWHLRRSGKKLNITVEPLDALTTTHRRQLDAQVERIGEILDGTPTLTIGAVTVGAHA